MKELFILFTQIKMENGKIFNNYDKMHQIV